VTSARRSEERTFRRPSRKDELLNGNKGAQAFVRAHSNGVVRPSPRCWIGGLILGPLSGWLMLPV